MAQFIGNAAGGHPAVVNTALEILKSGGNAFDALVAASLVSTLAEPMLGSLGGGGLLLARTSSGEKRFFDFFVNFPGLGKTQHEFQLEPVEVQFGSAYQVFFIGTHSICPPGVLKGLIHVHNELGWMPLKDLVQPAIQMAKEGVVVDKTQAYVIKILYPIMVQSGKGKELFEPRGHLIEEGELFKNPEFAAYLENLSASKGEDIYKGSLGRELLDALGDETLLTQKDLEDYKVVERAAESFTYRGQKIYTSPRPTLGGIMMISLLKAMAEHDLSSFKWGSPEHITLLGRAMVEVENKKTLILANKFTKGTTHISITDKEQNCVSFSMSNGQGCGHFIPGTGIMMNNMLGEDDLFKVGVDDLTPGERIPSMMSPTLLEMTSGEVFVFGAGGSKRIRSSIMQTLSNIADFQLDLASAVNKPRINWDGEVFQIEKGYARETLDALAHEYGINEWDELGFYFGGVHSAQLGQAAHSDPRRGG